MEDVSGLLSLLNELSSLVVFASLEEMEWKTLVACCLY